MWLEDENMSHWLLGSTWKRHRTVSSKKEENVSSSTLNSKDLQDLLCKQSWSTFCSLSSCNSKIGGSLGPIFSQLLKIIVLEKKKLSPEKNDLSLLRYSRKKRQNKYLIWKRNDGQYSLWDKTLSSENTCYLK